MFLYGEESRATEKKEMDEETERWDKKGKYSTA